MAASLNEVIIYEFGKKICPGHVDSRQIIGWILKKNQTPGQGQTRFPITTIL